MSNNAPAKRDAEDQAAHKGRTNTNSVEYGLFNDEGLVVGDFWSQAEALDALTAYDPDDRLTPAKVCPSCRDGYADDCDCEDDK